MSLKLCKLKVRNFLSYGNNTNELDLDFTGTTLVVGENLDAGGHNGVGKSTIVNAISYALYDKPISNIGKEKLLNRTNDAKSTQMEIVLEFEKEGIVFEIQRTRGSKNSIKITKDFEHDITPDSVANSNAFIGELIGISYELFRRTVVFTGSDISFFEMGLAGQRALTEELFKTTKLSEKAEVLKKVISDTKKDIDVQTAIISQQQQAKALRDKHISEAETRTVNWETDRQNKIVQFKNQLKFIEELDFKSNEELFEEEAKLIEKGAELVKIMNPIIEDEYDKKSKLSNTKTKRANLEKQVTDLKIQLEHLEDSKCPYCKQTYNSKETIDSIVKSLEVNEPELEQLKEKELHSLEVLNAISIKKESIQSEIDEYNSILVSVKNAKSFDSIEKLIEAKESSKHIESQIRDLEDAVNPHLDAYESLISEDDVVVDTEKLDELKNDLEHQNFLLKLLTDKNSFIRKKIINRTIPFLNGRIREYTTELGLPHLVKFQPDMSCLITEHGRELDYGNLSGGEKKRLNLSVSLAFRDVLQHLHSSINILIADEIDGGSVDTEGVEAMIKLIKHKAREDNLGIWVISHRPELSGRMDRELLIQKENGFSNFIEFR